MITIEKDVPMPETRGRRRVYPWNEMEVGDSFVVDPSKKTSVYTSAFAFRRKYCDGFTIRIRSEGDDQLRVWRVK